MKALLAVATLLLIPANASPPDQSSFTIGKFNAYIVHVPQMDAYCLVVEGTTGYYGQRNPGVSCLPIKR